MANEIDMKIVVGSEADVKTSEQTGKNIKKAIEKGIGNNGYIKLKPEIAKFKYPKQTTSKSGLKRGADYTNLQKAQDQLFSDWKKLSKKGFSSRDEDLITVLKSFRDYQNEITRHYGTSPKKDPRRKDPATLTETEKQVVNVIAHIGQSLEKYFIRLLTEDSSIGTKGSLMSIVNNKEFERYAARIIQRHKAATAAGVDLSKEELTKSDTKRIDIAEIAVKRKAEQEKVLSEREYERKHAKQTIKNEKKQLKQIEKERAKIQKNAVKLEKPTEPLEEIQLSATKVVNLAEPTDYKQTREDKKEDKRFIKGARRGAVTRASNTPGNDINLDIRSQKWSPLYSYGDEKENEKFFRRMERGGTYIDSNSLLKQTYQALPEEIKRANKELVKYIDKDKAIEAYTKISSEEAQEIERRENETGMSRLLLTYVAKIQGALMAGKKGVEPQDLVDAIDVAVADAVEHGRSAIAAENYNRAIMSIINMLMNRYSNMKDRIGTDVSRNKKSGKEEELGVGRNYEVVADTLTEIFEKLQYTADELLKRAIKEFPEFYGGTTSSETSKKKKMSTFDKVFAEKLEALRQEVTTDTTEVAKITEKQGRFDRAEYSAERVADTREGQINREINASIAEDTHTGMNTDANTTKLFAYLETIGSFTDELAASLSVLASAFDPDKKRTNANGKGGFIPPTENSTDGSYGNNEDGSQQSLLAQIAQNLKNIDVNVGNILQKLINPEGHIPTNALALIPGEGVKTHEQVKEPFDDKTNFKRLHDRRAEREVEEERAVLNKQLSEKLEKQVLEQEEKRILQEKIEKLISGEIPSAIEETTFSTSDTGIFGNIKKSLSKTTPNIDDILKMNQEQQELLLAKRRKEFGLSNTIRNVTDTGDVGQVSRTGFLWYKKNKNRAEDMNPFKDLKITPGLNVDYAGITEKLQTTIEKNQFKAQAGGGFFKQFFGSMTFYLGQDSVEKSRAQIDGLNEVLKTMKDVVSDLVASIQVEEKALKGMEKRGEATFEPDGRLAESSTNEAFVSAARMEELKLGLQGVLAEIAMTDTLTEALGGDVKEILKRLGFVAPELQKCNKIIKNVNSGLDKSGKALKFQRRTQEIMNYSYQLMARHIGQIVKTWIMALNPVRVLSNVVKKMTQGIKSAFQDFASYDVKWQRTMNVIKYNFRAIIRPAMQWIAQKLVNIIGFFDIIIMKIQEAFGKVPVSLFDQSAANAEKMREELEEAANVTAGFDELHDISGETAGGGDPAMDLMGDIYKPQLSEDWIALAEKIGDVFGKLFTGDMGFGEALGKIFSLLGEALGKIGKMIWDWFKQTSLGEYLTENWKKILGTILAVFLGWQLLKIAGQALFDALFGKLLGKGVITGIFSNIGSMITSALGASAFGSGIIMGLQGLLTGVGLPTLLKAATDPTLVAAMGGWGQTLGAIFAQAFVAVASVIIGVIGNVIGFDMIADDTSYNLGVRHAGGSKDDERGSAGGTILNIATGAIAGLGVGLVSGFASGGPIGAAIGAAAGLLTSLLAPAIEEVTVLSKNLNNEMQKVEYYQGYVKVATSEVNSLDEMLQMSNKTLEAQKQKVYEAAEEFGLEKDKVEALVKSVEDGSFSVEQLSGNYVYLADSLLQLDYHQQKNIETTKKLEEAKKKLMKAELELAIAEDVAAGNFEMAAARVEYAYASDLYTITEATNKITQIIKEGSAEQANAILTDLSPEIKANWDRYTATTDSGFKEIVKYYDSLKDAEKDAFLQDINPELKSKLNARNQLIKQKVEEANGFLRMLDIGNDGKILGISYIGHDIPGYATGTNYVPNDGLAYLHQGEAVIPKKYNQPYTPEMSANEQAYMERMMTTMKALDDTMKQGIKVNGQFTQRGSDLVAVVNRVNSQTGSNLISNMSYAR